MLSTRVIAVGRIRAGRTTSATAPGNPACAGNRDCGGASGPPLLSSISGAAHRGVQFGRSKNKMLVAKRSRPPCGRGFHAPVISGSPHRSRDSDSGDRHWRTGAGTCCSSTISRCSAFMLQLLSVNCTASQSRSGGVSGGLTVLSEVDDRRDQRLSKMAKPNMVHRDTGRQRILPAGYPVG